VARATTAGGSVRLKPGQRVICQRTYGSLVSKVKETTYRPGSQSVRRFKVRVPSYLGVRIVD